MSLDATVKKRWGGKHRSLVQVVCRGREQAIFVIPASHFFQTVREDSAKHRFDSGWETIANNHVLSHLVLRELFIERTEVSLIMDSLRRV